MPLFMLKRFSGFALSRLCEIAIFAAVFVPLAAANAQPPLQDRDLRRNEVAVSVLQKRVALVIGNKDYADSPLTNPINDADAMAQALKDLGFEVIRRQNLTLSQMDEAVNSFTQKLDKNAIGLFYFSGHGVQVEGVNYLVPIGYVVHRQSDVKYQALPAAQVRDAMTQTGCGLSILVLDACRNNPLPKGIKDTGAGLAKMGAPLGTLVAYAASPGETASDDPDKPNGLYTGVLLQKMKTPGLKIEDVFKRTRDSVLRATSGRQTPMEESILVNDFYFVESTVLVPPPVVPMPPPAAPIASPPTPSGRTKNGINPKDGAELVYIPAGPFLMGDDAQSDNKQRTVRLPAYSIYKNDVTVAMYEKFCRATGREMPAAPKFNEGWSKKNHPIVNVTWKDAKEYCVWAGGVLPSEAQWEKAARGTDGRTYPWGNVFDHAKLRTDLLTTDEWTAPVGSFPSGASPYGVLDMAGNVWQWCDDWYSKAQGYKVMRGGSWSYDFFASTFSCAHRSLYVPAGWNDNIGFRCVVL